MKYDFKCSTCEQVSERSMSVEAFPEAKASGVPCDACGERAFFLFNPKGTQISFAGDAWADKNFKEKTYRKNRSKYMGQRMRTNHKVPELLPNFEGEVADTWEDARDAARDAGKITETYDRLIKRDRLRK